jgi:hypothetical protein
MLEARKTCQQTAPVGGSAVTVGATAASMSWISDERMPPNQPQAPHYVAFWCPPPGTSEMQRQPASTVILDDKAVTALDQVGAAVTIMRGF